MSTQPVKVMEKKLDENIDRVVRDMTRTGAADADAAARAEANAIAVARVMARVRGAQDAAAGSRGAHGSRTGDGGRHNSPAEHGEWSGDVQHSNRAPRAGVRIEWIYAATALMALIALAVGSNWRSRSHERGGAERTHQATRLARATPPREAGPPSSAEPPAPVAGPSQGIALRSGPGGPSSYAAAASASSPSRRAARQAVARSIAVPPGAGAVPANRPQPWFVERAPDALAAPIPAPSTSAASTPATSTSAVEPATRGIDYEAMKRSIAVEAIVAPPLAPPAAVSAGYIAAPTFATIEPIPVSPLTIPPIGSER